MREAGRSGFSHDDPQVYPQILWINLLRLSFVWMAPICGGKAAITWPVGSRVSALNRILVAAATLNADRAGVSLRRNFVFACHPLCIAESAYSG